MTIRLLPRFTVSGENDVRSILVAAFDGEFEESDWRHALETPYDPSASRWHALLAKAMPGEPPALQSPCTLAVFN